MIMHLLQISPVFWQWQTQPDAQTAARVGFVTTVLHHYIGRRRFNDAVKQCDLLNSASMYSNSRWWKGRLDATNGRKGQIEVWQSGDLSIV